MPNRGCKGGGQLAWLDMGGHKKKGRGQIAWPDMGGEGKGWAHLSAMRAAARDEGQ